MIILDIDECEDGTDNCDSNATCANTPGNFTCACNEGYSGDGVTCDGMAYMYNGIKIFIANTLYLISISRQSINYS